MEENGTAALLLHTPGLHAHNQTAGKLHCLRRDKQRASTLVLMLTWLGLTEQVL